MLYRDSWSGRIVTGDTVEYNAATNVLKERTGKTVLSNVELHGFGAQDTKEAAITFKGARTNSSIVTHCSIHNSMAWGVGIKDSNNIEFTNNFIFNTRPFGFVIDTATNVTIDSNILIKVVGRDVEGGAGTGSMSYRDKEGGFAICSVYDSDRACINVTTSNNIVANSINAGYWAVGH